VHFTRHGIPFANEIASYENVQLINQAPVTGGGSRLVNLKNKVFGVEPLIGNQLFGSNPAGRFGGPNSVYGVGFTKATRFVDTTEGTIPGIAVLVKRSLLRGLENVGSVVRDTNNYIPVYSIGSQYASVLSKARISTTNDDTNKNSTNNVDEQSSANTGERSSLKTRTTNNSNSSTDIREAFEVAKPNPFSRKPDIDRDTATTPTIEAADYGTPGGDIRNYSTLSYSKIPKKGKVAEQGGFNDFRLDVTEYDGSTGFLGDITNSNYKQKNLEKSGWGTQGAVGADRSDYTKPSDRGDKVNLIGYGKNVLSAKLA
jgi:hypothetical protein